MTKIIVVNTVQYEALECAAPDFYEEFAKWLEVPVEQLAPLDVPIANHMWALRHPEGEINFVDPLVFTDEFETISSDEPIWKAFEQKAAKDAETVRRVNLWVKTLSAEQQLQWLTYMDAEAP